MVQAGMPEIEDFSMQQHPLEIAAWTPGSPRLSFSRDFVQSDVFHPSTRDSAGATSDFDFGMLALLKMDDPVSTTPMLPADELFHNGRLLPVDVASTSTAIAPTGTKSKAEDPSVHQLLLQEASDTIGALEQSGSNSAPLQNPQQIPKSPSSRWKELFGLKRSSRGSLSETEPLNILNGSPSSSSGRFSSASKLKLLFRSSSAGAGRGERTAVEPCLGRSASESKVSSCCNNLQVVENNAAVAGGKAAAAPDAQLLESMAGWTSTSDESRPLSSSSSLHKSQHRRRRKVLVEVKGSPARMNSRASSSAAPRSPNYQRLNQNSHPRLRQQQQQQQKNNKKDAWKVYNERINASNAAVGAGASVKVAEVLHMEVCMGQSMVVSKVAKARIFDFMKKENKSSDAHDKASAAKGA